MVPLQAMALAPSCRCSTSTAAAVAPDWIASGSQSSLRIRACSSASSDGLRRPSAPAVKPAAPSSSPPTPVAAPAPPPPPPPPVDSTTQSAPMVTIEFQRQRAKQLQEYFLDKKFEEQARKGQIFGWTPQNEVGNGRWAMFGIAVGLLTEFATGSDFIEQLKIIVSNLGIAEVE